MSETKIGPWLSGNHTAYQAEFFDVDKEWKVIPTEKRLPFDGIPAPLRHGKINAVVGLMGFEQALAIAYWFLAACCADAHKVFCPQVRIQQYDIRYSVETTRKDVMAVPTMFTVTEKVVTENA